MFVIREIEENNYGYKKRCVMKTNNTKDIYDTVLNIIGSEYASLNAVKDAAEMSFGDIVTSLYFGYEIECVEE